MPLEKSSERWFRKKLQMQGAQKLGSAAYSLVRCNDKGEAQRRRWTFYEAISFKRIEAGKAGFTFP
jgi:hypothetical protein